MWAPQQCAATTRFPTPTRAQTQPHPPGIALAILDHLLRVEAQGRVLGSGLGATSCQALRPGSVWG